MALSVLGDLVFGGVEFGSGLGDAAMTSTGVLVGSVGRGGVVMVGGRTGLVSEGLAVAGGLLDGGVGGGTAEGMVGVGVILRWGGVLRLRLRLRLSLGVDIKGFA